MDIQYIIFIYSYFVLYINSRAWPACTAAASPCPAPRWCSTCCGTSPRSATRARAPAGQPRPRVLGTPHCPATSWGWGWAGPLPGRRWGRLPPSRAAPAWCRPGRRRGPPSRCYSQSPWLRQCRCPPADSAASVTCCLPKNPCVTRPNVDLYIYDIFVHVFSLLGLQLCKKAGLPLLVGGVRVRFGPRAETLEDALAVTRGRGNGHAARLSLIFVIRRQAGRLSENHIIMITKQAIRTFYCVLRIFKRTYI